MPSQGQRRRLALTIYGVALVALVVTLAGSLRAQYLSELERIDQRLLARASVVEALVGGAFDTVSSTLSGILALDDALDGVDAGYSRDALLAERAAQVPLVDRLMMAPLSVPQESALANGWLPLDSFHQYLAALAPGDTLISPLHRPGARRWLPGDRGTAQRLSDIIATRGSGAGGSAAAGRAYRRPGTGGWGEHCTGR